MTKTSPSGGSPLLLNDVLDALRDPLRRQVVRRLAGQELMCSAFSDLGTASGMSYHFTRLRTAGITNMRKAGSCRMISLRSAEIEEAFPGLLDSIFHAMAREDNGSVKTSGNDDEN
jgi:DNA-binding transcriptional ArsR family regulator